PLRRGLSCARRQQRGCTCCATGATATGRGPASPPERRRPPISEFWSSREARCHVFFIVGPLANIPAPAIQGVVRLPHALRPLSSLLGQVEIHLQSNGVRHAEQDRHPRL